MAMSVLQEEQRSASLQNSVNLDSGDLSATAKVNFKFFDDILRAFKLSSDGVLSIKELSPIGRHIICSTIERNFSNCKQLLNYAADNHITESTIDILKPLVICGLPRTGTTLLYNLLNCDPASRAPLLTDMTQPVPPIARSNTEAHQRRADIEHARAMQLEELGFQTDLKAIMEASHPTLTIEEDLLVFDQAGLSFSYSFIGSNEDNELLHRYLDDSSKESAYAYHKTFLQVLNSVDAPRSHWLLKACDHSLFLYSLLRQYPSARLIMIHRRLDHVVPSLCCLTKAYCSMFFNKLDEVTKKACIERTIYFFDTIIPRIVEFRRNNTKQSVFDVRYDDLVEKPIETVHRIYNHFHLNWTNEFESSMKAWLRDNPQGKNGRNIYTLKDCTLNENEITRRYKDYIDMFLGHRLSSQQEEELIESTSE